jgi:hypothetical protein
MVGERHRTDLDLQQRVGGSALYTNVLVDRPARSITRSLAFGSTYRFRARARDASDRAGPFATAPGFKTVLIQETARPPNLVYSGAWTRTTQSGASGNAVRSSTDRGATATFSFTGRNGAVVMPRRQGLGTAQVCVDPGTARQRCSTVDLSPATGRGARKLVFVANGLDPSRGHKLRVKVLNGRADLDAFVRLG